MRYAILIGITLLVAVGIAAPTQAGDDEAQAGRQARIAKLEQLNVEIARQLAHLKQYYTEDNPRLRALMDEHSRVQAELQAIRTEGASREAEKANAAKHLEEVARRIEEHRARLNELERRVMERPDDAALAQQVASVRRNIETLVAALQRSKGHTGKQEDLAREVARAEAEGRITLGRMLRAKETFAEDEAKLLDAREARRALEEAKARIDAQAAAVDRLSAVRALLDKGDLEGARRAREELAVATAALEALGEGHQAGGARAKEPPAPTSFWWGETFLLPEGPDLETFFQPPQAASRLEHLKAAARHLRQAGAHEQAKAIEKEAREMERRMKAAGGNAEVLRALGALRTEVNSLREEVRQIELLLGAKARRR